VILSYAWFDSYIYLTGKPAKISSLHGPSKYYASKAVDGIYTAHSTLEHRPWWRVDLVDIYCVWAVNILNRGNGMFHVLMNLFTYRIQSLGFNLNFVFLYVDKLGYMLFFAMFS